MTDEKIIMALECCKDPMASCDECFLVNADRYCERTLMGNALDLINRQKAEIERLKINLKAVLDERADHSEAIKEFAERLKAYLHQDDFGTPDERWKPESEFAILIDNLVKEMVGDTE